MGELVMTDETYKKMVKMARKWVTLLAPLVSIEYNKKLDGFDWIFNETTPKGSCQEVALNFKSFVMTVSSARESLLKENSDLIEREFPLSQFETMGSLLTIYLNDDRTNVWINRIARPGYDLARAPIFIV